MNKNRLIFYCLLFALSAYNCYGQAVNNEIDLQKKQIEHAAAIQKNALGEQDKILNGSDYQFYGPIYMGVPYFSGKAGWLPGTVVYNNVSYPNMSLMYDTYKDQLVLLHYNKFQQYSLYSPRVQSFDMLDHHFVYLEDASAKPQIKPGFYDELYGGKLQLLAKRETVAYDSIAGNSMYKNFVYGITYYYKNGEKYYRVKSRSDALNALKDKKKELERYIKSNDLNFGANREQSLLMTLTYYEQISK